MSNMVWLSWNIALGVLLLWADSTLSDEDVGLRILQTQLQQLQQDQAKINQKNDDLHGQVQQLQLEQIKVRQENVDLKTEVQKIHCENDEMKTQVQKMHSKNDHLESEVKKIHRENDDLKNEVQHLQQIQTEMRRENSEDRIKRPLDIGRPPAKCVLGSNFLFDEYPDTYGAAITYPIDAGENTYRCLDMCRQDPDCVAVSISKNAPKQCGAYTDVPASLVAASDWDYYQMSYTNSCWVDKPVVEFMASITNSVCVDDNEMVGWDNVIYDSGDGMKSDGRFHCPVAGYYKLTFDAHIYDGTTDIFSVRKNDQIELARYHSYSYNIEGISGSVDVYTYCDVDDTVSVWGERNDSCIWGANPVVYSSFSGRLV